MNGEENETIETGENPLPWTLQSKDSTTTENDSKKPNNNEEEEEEEPPSPVTYEMAMKTLKYMFGPRNWSLQMLDMVLRHHGGHMENTIAEILLHEDGEPWELIDKLKNGSGGAEKKKKKSNGSGDDSEITNASVKKPGAYHVSTPVNSSLSEEEKKKEKKNARGNNSGSDDLPPSVLNQISQEDNIPKKKPGAYHVLSAVNSSFGDDDEEKKKKMSSGNEISKPTTNLVVPQSSYTSSGGIPSSQQIPGTLYRRNHVGQNESLQPKQIQNKILTSTLIKKNKLDEVFTVKGSNDNHDQVSMDKIKQKVSDNEKDNANVRKDQISPEADGPKSENMTTTNTTTNMNLQNEDPKNNIKMSRRNKNVRPGAEMVIPSMKNGKAAAAAAAAYNVNYIDDKLEKKKIKNAIKSERVVDPSRKRISTPATIQQSQNEEPFQDEEDEEEDLESPNDGENSNENKLVVDAAIAPVPRGMKNGGGGGGNGGRNSVEEAVRQHMIGNSIAVEVLPTVAKKKKGSNSSFCDMILTKKVLVPALIGIVVVGGVLITLFLLGTFETVFDRVAHVKSILHPLYPNGGEFLVDETSNQYKAMMWLSDNPNLQSYSDDRLIQRYALRVFYLSLDGRQWLLDNQYLWLDDTDECLWNGIICNENEVVTSIELDSKGLVGSLPYEMVLLSNLKFLYLENNNLDSSIPPWLGNLTLLEKLSLEGSQMTGSIPVSLGYFKNLKSLNVQRNKLTGTIPKVLGNLTSINDLRLGDNELKGGIPSTFIQLINAKTLWLGNCNMTGTIPAEIGNLSLLVSLRLHDNLISGEIPSSASKLVNLRNLWIQNNRLTGTIPVSLGNLSNIEQFYAEKNDLIGKMPESVCHLRKTNGGGNLETLQADCAGDSPELICSLECCTSCH